MTSFTGLAGVGSLITPTCKIRDLHDFFLLHQFCSDSLPLCIGCGNSGLNLYLHSCHICPCLPETPPAIFSALPRHFKDDDHHIVMGDFNTVLTTRFDQACSTNRSRLQGRDELLSWMSALRLVDLSRLQHPDVQELTGPTCASRIDYRFVNYGLFRSVFNTGFQ